jgi:hypothetical protein
VALANWKEKDRRVFGGVKAGARARLRLHECTLVDLIKTLREV